MSLFSNPSVTRRFIKLMALLTFLMVCVWVGITWYDGSVPGDFEVRQGDIQLSDGKFNAAIESFESALAAQPDHRGALHGKAASLIALKRYEEAEATLDYLIDYLNQTLEEDDPTGIGALSAAFINRGIIKDRQGRYEEALEDYVNSAKTDYEIADGPNWVEHLLYYDRTPSSPIKRAQYIFEQLKLPEEERVLSNPEIDDAQRMYKP
ncbi:MAG: tetratricopeptide repeat protein [Rhodospirillales bacterium]|jgi:tetratricopeptide (TPR) repeat protein|nr:tetratricopeptide repeat protein [Rhodospirillales bacterium]